MTHQIVLRCLTFSFSFWGRFWGRGDRWLTWSNYRWFFYCPVWWYTGSSFRTDRPHDGVSDEVIASLASHHPDTGLALAFTVVMLGDLLQIIFGLMGLGQYITLLPYTVIAGFMSGVLFQCNVLDNDSFKCLTIK